MDWKLFLEYIKVIIYPVIISGFLFYFRDRIGGLIDRIKSIKGPGGTEVDLEDQIKSQQKGINAEQINLHLKQQISDEIKKEVKGEYEEKIKKMGESEQQLKTVLTYTQIYLDFERIYRVIFGTQIELLKRLRANSSLGEAKTDSIFFFVLNQKIYPILSSWNFELYINFLLDNDLVSFQNQNDYYFITDKGRAFLVYIEYLNFPPKSL